MLRRVRVECGRQEDRRAAWAESGQVWFCFFTKSTHHKVAHGTQIMNGSGSQQISSQWSFHWCLVDIGQDTEAIGNQRLSPDTQAQCCSASPMGTGGDGVEARLALAR